MVVGIISADSLLNYPDFRSFERSYQLMLQVSGRAGRKLGQGKVIIQTSSPQHHIINQVVKHSYDEMFRTEMMERKNFNYPPYYRLIRITVKHRDKDVMNRSSQILASYFKHIKNTTVLGPQYPLVARTFNLYQKCITIKTPRTVNLRLVKDAITQACNTVKTTPDFKSVQLVIDVDPV